MLGQEVLLDELGDLELVLDALPVACLDLLLPDQLRHANRRRRLRGQVLEQLAVVARILLLGQAGAEVQQPDQLALRHQRNDELEPLRAHLLERGRVERELLHVDRPGRGVLEVVEQRVVGGDVQLGRFRLLGLEGHRS